jgi:hypothetical protein
MGFLDDLLPVRRILIDGVEQEFRSDLNLVGAQIEDDPATLALRVKFGLRVAGFVSGSTLRADYLCLLDDNEDITPSFILPAPSTWSGQRIVVKRLNQAAASVELSVAGGATIDGASTYVLVGADVAAEFWSDGVSVYVGPTSTIVTPEWTPADLPGITWIDAPDDATKRTLGPGNRVDQLVSLLPGGAIMNRTAGTPTIDPATVLNGKQLWRLDATTEIAIGSGGPVGNEAWWIVTLCKGDSVSAGGLSRVGARAGSGSLGISSGGYYAAGRPTIEGLPRVETPLADGNPRIVQAQYMPAYSYLFSGFDGRLPPDATANWYFSKSGLTMDGSMAHGHAEVAGSANTSARGRTFIGRGVLNGGPMARLTNWIVEFYALPRTAPRILFIGDSLIANPGTAPATGDSWAQRARDQLNTQLTIDGRTNLDISFLAQAGRYLGGAWDNSNPPMAFNADGNYPTISATIVNRTAPWSRSARRQYEIAVAMGGTNDFINGNVSSAECIARLKYVWGALMAQGYYVVAPTIPPGFLNAGFWSTTREAGRVAVNAWITGSAVAEGYAHATIDWEAGGLVYGATYYSGDALHPNDAGHILMRDIAYPVLYNLIVNTVRSPIGALT